MKRRHVLSALFAAAALPYDVRAQQPDRTRRIGYMVFGLETEYTRSMLDTFRATLKHLGWSEGENIGLIIRWTGSEIGKIRATASEMVGLHPDLIVASGTPLVLALKNEGSSIPIVFMFVSDPVGSGIVGDLAHPGGKVTGFTAFEPSMAGKWLQILREIVPSVRRIGLLFNPTTAPNAQLFIREMEPIASSMSIALSRIPVHDVSEMDVALKTFASAEYVALVVVPDIFTTANRKRLIAVVAELRLPTIYSYPLFVTDGGLVSYGIPNRAQYSQAAAYVDRILRGAYPGDLPVQQPTKFELTINVKTANALGLTISPMLLASVDEVIE
jgi:putative ABC transport system substrate-binding protein